MSNYYYEVRRFQSHSNFFKVEEESYSLKAVLRIAQKLLKTEGSKFIQIWRIYPRRTHPDLLLKEWN